jgi:hypothetical protein
VLDQLEAGQHALRIDSDQDLNRFSGIADCIGEIGIEIDEALQLVAPEDWSDGRIALRQTKPVSFRKEVRGRYLR